MTFNLAEIINKYVPVQLVGNEVSVLREFKSSEELIGSSIRGFGDNVSSSGYVRPINLSKHKQKAFIVENNHDVVINVSVRYHANLSALSSGGTLLNSEVMTLTLEPGSSVYAPPSQYPEMNDPCIGITFLVVANTPPSSGSIDLLLIGGVV